VIPRQPNGQSTVGIKNKVIRQFARFKWQAHPNLKFQLKNALEGSLLAKFTGSLALAISKTDFIEHSAEVFSTCLAVLHYETLSPD